MKNIQIIFQRHCNSKAETGSVITSLIKYCSQVLSCSLKSNIYSNKQFTYFAQSIDKTTTPTRTPFPLP